MAIRSLEVLKSWFETGDKPTQEQFSDLIDTLGAVCGGIESDYTIVQQAGVNNPRAISKHTSAFGLDSISGLKGYYYKHINFDEANNRVSVYLTLNRGTITQNPTLPPPVDPNFPQIFSVGDLVSIVNLETYEDAIEILEINHNVLYFDKSTFPFTSVKEISDLNQRVYDYSIYSTNLGSDNKNLVDLGMAAHAEGLSTKSLNYATHAEGYNTQASGAYSHAEGHSTKANYAAHAEGRNTQAIGEYSHTEGYNTQASGNAAHAEGLSTKAIGKASHAEGNNTQTTNDFEHASGRFNKSNTGTRFSVGIGTSDSNRKNALEVMADGRVFILGLGGYNGTNPENSTDLAKLLA